MFKRSGKLLFLIVLLGTAGAGCRGDGTQSEAMELTRTADYTTLESAECLAARQACCENDSPPGTWLVKQESISCNFDLTGRNIDDYFCAQDNCMMTKARECCNAYIRTKADQHDYCSSTEWTCEHTSQETQCVGE